METYDKDQLENEKLIKNIIVNYLKIMESEEQKKTEKLLIYNLLN